MEPDSLLVRGLVDNASRGLSPALDRSTTFEREPGGTSPYGRGHAPVAAEAEALLGALEDAQATLFSSGMTAWTCVCLALLGEGKALVIPTSGYYEVELLGSRVLANFGVDVRRYDLRDAAGFRRACDGATLAIIETPSNPLLGVTDVAAAAAAAHAGGALLCCDNTFATPLLQRPLDLGADLAWQSATKYLAGHSDLLAGVVTTRDEALHDRLVWVRRTVGGVLAPDPAWLLLRGLRTLHVRLPRQVETAAELARRLAAHPASGSALPRPARPPRIRARPPADARRSGGVLAFELADGAAAGRCEDAVRLARNATSLGGVETLIERRARIEPEGRVPEGLLRLAVGLEDVDDLWADLAGAIRRRSARRGRRARERRRVRFRLGCASWHATTNARPAPVSRRSSAPPRRSRHPRRDAPHAVAREHLRGLADALLVDDFPGATISRAERELIATAVSAGNDCFYCMDSHGAFAAELLEREGTDGVSGLIDGIKSGGSGGPLAQARRARRDRPRRPARSARRRARRGRARARRGRDRCRHAARGPDRGRVLHVQPHGRRPARGDAAECRGLPRARRADRRPRLQRLAGHRDPALERYECVLLDAERDVAGCVHGCRVADAEWPVRSALGHDRDLQPQAGGLAESALRLGHGPQPAGQRDLAESAHRPERHAACGRGERERDREVGSRLVERTPPATLTNTSCCPSPSPPWRASTASSNERRLRSKPLARRRGMASSLGATSA